MRSIHFFISQLLVAGMAIAGCQPQSHSPPSSGQVSNFSTPSQYPEKAKKQSMENNDSYDRQHLAEEARHLSKEKLSITLQDIEPALVQEGETLQLALDKEELSNGRCNLIVRYPVIEGLRNTKLQTQLNAATRERSFNRLYSWSTIGSAECVPDAGEPILKTEIYLCEIGFAQKNLLSWNCRASVQSGARPWFFNQPVTIDLATGQFYEYPDLFKPDSDYAYRVAYQVAVGWRDVYATDDLSPSALKPEEGVLDRDFYLHSDCATFAPNLIAPERFNDGEACLIALDSGLLTADVDIPIPIHELRDILRPGSALSVLME